MSTHPRHYTGCTGSCWNKKKGWISPCFSSIPKCKWTHYILEKWQDGHTYVLARNWTIRTLSASCLCASILTCLNLVGIRLLVLACSSNSRYRTHHSLRCWCCMHAQEAQQSLGYKWDIDQYFISEVIIGVYFLVPFWKKIKEKVLLELYIKRRNRGRNKRIGTNKKG
jgi:hypothetical protein